jgi:type VI secretion system FHA domain protein
MVLTLEISGPQASRLGASSRKVFRASGGTIGRLPTNDWALPDPYVSNRHALIRFRDGAFFIEDTSTNGVSINAPENRLAKGTAHRLQAGDWIFIEPYEIKVSIEEATHAAPPAAASSPFDDLFGPVASRGYDARSAPDPFGSAPGGTPAVPALPGPLEPVEPVASGDEVDPMALLGFAPRNESPPSLRAADLERGTPWSDPYKAPAVPQAPVTPAAEARLIPDDWLNPDRPSTVGPRSPRSSHEGAGAAEGTGLPVPPPASRPAAAPRPAPGARPRGASLDLTELLAGAGLEDVAVTPEMARNFGRILRVVVAGVMDSLQARQKIKNEFRLGMTTFKPADNNPLKFSANVDDALHNLLVKRNPAFLGPVEAFEDAFDDIRNHQIALLQAVRVAFDAMLAEFDPDRLQQEFDQRGKGALISVPAKLRYWDQYRGKIHDMVSDADASFRELFGDEFANAYEQQLHRLRAQRRQP